MSVKKLLQEIETAVNALGKGSPMPGACDIMGRALVAVQELRAIVLEFLVECPKCDGACGFLSKRDPKQRGPEYTPCSYCGGFGCLSRKMPKELFPPAKFSVKK